MREIAKGHDGWYFENQKIEPTAEEIKAWEDKFCDYCCMGVLFPKDKTLSTTEQCNRQIPCPACFGTGMKDHTKYFKSASGGKVVNVTGPMIDPDTFSLKQHVTVEFSWHKPGQQDGRPLHKLYENYLRVLHIGRTVWQAMLEKNV